MARKRLQQKGDLYQQGGWWKLRWREDQRKADGAIRYGWSKAVFIGPSEGVKRLTEKQAKRIAWENFLSLLDQNTRTPQSVMTVAEFVERKFIPEHVAMLKPSGRQHYDSMLPHVLEGIPEKRKSQKKLNPGEVAPIINRNFGLGEMRLRDVTLDDAQRLVSEALRRKYSVQTARHIKNSISAIFTHAEVKAWFTGQNPAKHVKLPEMVRREPRALSFEELKLLLRSLKPTARAMVLCASLTSMNIAEVCGLRWKRVNLSEDPIIVDGESLPGMHLAVREQWYLRQFGTVKARARRRNLPIPSLLSEALKDLYGRTEMRGSDSPVFAGTTGRPIDAGAMLNRQIRKAAKLFDAPKIGWHDLRRTFATLADQLGMTIGERQALMGHSKAVMTLQYTKTSTEQARVALEELVGKVGFIQ